MIHHVVVAVLGLLALLLYAAERSLSLFTWSRLEELEVPRPRRQAVEECLEDRELVSTTLATFAGMAFAAFVVGLLLDSVRADIRLLQAALLGLGMVWLVPELLAWKLGDRVVIHLVPPLCRLCAVPFRMVRRLVARSPSAEGAEAAVSEEETKTDAAGADAEAHEFFRMAVRLKHIQVREIMTPRTAMVSVPDTATIRQAAQVSRQSGYSRLPVHRGNRDQIIGVVHAKDFLEFASTESWDQARLNDLIRAPFFVPETKTVSELMEELQRTNTHMGVVLDEYGGTCGLVTLEDVVEELIGDIHDEYESAGEEPPLLKWIDDRSVEVRAVMRIEEFNEECQGEFPEQEDYDTIGGFVMLVLGRIPAKGDSLRYRDALITVLEADPRRVLRVRVDFDEPHRPVEKT